MAKLLIVDDHKETRMFLRSAMRQDGYQVIDAQTGEECLALAQQESPDMILLDAKMPGMDGFSCCTQLKATLQDQCPPILMMTGLTDHRSIDKAFSVGAIDYATKPINISALTHRVQRVLRERELMRQLAAVNQLLVTANRELQHIARVDKLTQLANRHSLEEVIVKEWGRLARYQRSLGIIFCDIDFFKQYNDLYGHLAGDCCLKDISKILRLSIMRAADFIARYGGEEFVILLPETDAPGTMEVAKRIHTKIKDAAIPHQGSQVASIVTLSIGVTSVIPKKTDDPNHFLDLADRALYEAKTKGRNQTVIMHLNNEVSE